MEGLSVERVLGLVKAGTLTRVAAAKLCNVSDWTIRDRLKGNRREKKGSSARKFSESEEAYIADLLLKCADHGVPLNKLLIKRIVTLLAARKDIASSRKYVTDYSHYWHRQFLRRHPGVSQRISHTTNRKQAREWTATTREGWMELLSNTHIDGLLDDPHGVWIFDESAFQVAERVSVVEAGRGVKDVLSYNDGIDEDLVTVLAGGNAAGEILRPLILCDGQVCFGCRSEGTGNRGFDPSGGMDCATFTSYIREEVIPAMTAEKNIIFLDGHSSHMFNLECLLECMKSDKNITVVILPASQTDQLQPMGVKVYGPVKNYWRIYLSDCSPALPNGVNKQTFVDHLMKKWDDCNMAEKIISGFGAAGIFPFDPQLVWEAFPEPTGKPKKPDNATLSIEYVYAAQLAKTRDALREIPLLTESAINRILRTVVKEALTYQLDDLGSQHIGRGDEEGQLDAIAHGEGESAAFGQISGGGVVRPQLLRSGFHMEVEEAHGARAHDGDGDDHGQVGVRP